MTMIAVTAAVVVFLSQHCIYLPVVQSESVWHQLQDHTAASHVNRQQQKNGDEIYNYPLLFTDTKIPASKAPSPSSSADAVIPTPSLLTTSTRNGRNMFMSMTKMMMMTTTTTTAKAPVSTPRTSSSIGNSTMTTQQSLKVTKSKKSSSPTTSNAPSVVGASIYPTVIEGKTKTMMRMSMNGHKNQRTTPSPSVSAQPTYLDDDGTLSPYPTIAVDVDKKGMMMIMSKNRKDQSPTLSPSISAEPTYIEDESSLYPSSTSNGGDNDVKARKGMGGSMSKDKKDKGTTPSPSVSAEPTYIEEDESSFNPTIANGKGMGGGGSMSKDQKDKVTTPSPSISAEPTYIEDETLYPTTAKGGDNGKGGMTMMSMSSMMSKGDDEETISPSASLVPSTTMVPTLSNNSKGSGGMMSGSSSSMMDSSMNMMMMSKGIYENPKMMMKKGPDDSKMNMSKMTLPPVPTLPETFIPTTAPNVLPTPPAPSPSPNNRVQLSPYTLRYTFNQTRIPLTFEVDEVVAVTRMYLAEYFEIRYMDMTEFVTNMTGTAFVLQQPFVINYTSVAVFNAMASMNDDDSVNIDIPPVEELDIILIAAFTTINLLNYITILQDLPPENLFRTTSNVTFMIDTMPDSNTNNTLRIKNENDDDQNKKGSKHSAKVTAGIATGAGVLVLALISVLAIRSRKNRNDIMHIDDHDMPPNKRNLNNQVDDEGHMTVAGDTYLAESTVISGGTTSILSSLSATRQRRNQRFKSKRILSQSRALVLAQPHPPTNESQYLTLTQPPPPPPSSSSSPSDISLLRGFSDNGSNDHYEHDDNASDQEIYENDDFDNNDDRSLLPFYTSSPEPAYQGALTVDVNERRHGGQPQDVLLSMRDDMRLPRHFRSPQISTSNNDKQQHYCDDHGNHIPNQMVLHHDIDENDDDTLSVDDDVPLRVIDLIRKFTPSRRRTSR